MLRASLLFLVLSALVAAAMGQNNMIAGTGSCVGTDETCISTEASTPNGDVQLQFPKVVINQAGQICSFANTANILILSAVYDIVSIVSGTITVTNGVITSYNNLVVNTIVDGTTTSAGTATINGAVVPSFQGMSTNLKVTFAPVTGGSVTGFITTHDSCTVSVVGDPQFVGLRGQSYQIHGVDGSVYNIISDANLQVNSKFVFLTEGVCPMFNGVADVNCWSHPGSYMGEMSFQAKVDGKLHAALLTSGSAKQGFAAIQMDGKNVKVGEQVTFGAFSLTAVTSHKVVIATEQFSFELTNSDMFINQALTPKVALSKMTAHGLLGQTHSAKTYPNAIKFIQGEVDDYTIADNDIFGDDFVYNQFKA